MRALVPVKIKHEASHTTSSAREERTSVAPDSIPVAITIVLNERIFLRGPVSKAAK